MSRFSSRLQAASLTLCLFLAGSALSTGALAAENAPAERDGVWAQNYTDVKPEGDVRFGQLPNGMRYAIMHNATPSGQVSIRLRMGTGSLQETDAQQGLAHFLEHMAFKGSTHVPEGDMIKMLERLGLSFGADTNASTSWDQTIYMLDLPQADEKSVDTGLMLTRETASELTLSQTAMDHERGVILSEERLRDTPGYRATKAWFSFLMEKQRVATRFPIGQIDVIKKAPVSQIADYYHANYRPERAALIVVGDIDPAAIETKIKGLFQSWSNPVPAPKSADLGKPLTRGTQARVLIEPGAPLNIQIAWPNPYDNGADSIAQRRRDTIREVALAVLNRRLELQAKKPQPPFLRAGAFRTNMFKSIDLTDLTISAAPEDWQKALQAAEETRRQAVSFGVQQAEVDREIVEMRTSHQNAVAGAATRRSPQLAGELVESAGEDEVFTSPADDMTIFENSVGGLTAADVSTVLRDIFKGQGPLVFMATPKALENADATLAATFKQAEESPLAAAAVEQSKSWPYANAFGAAGREVERREVSDLGVTFIRFANGVRLTVKPTKFRDDQILVDVRIGDGMLNLPSDKRTARWASASIISGGLKDLREDEIERIFNDKVVGADFAVADDAFELRGATRGADLDLQLQLLTAYLTAPGYRTEAFERLRTSFRTQLDQLDSTPAGVLGRDLAFLTHSGDYRWSIPDKTVLAETKPDDLRAMLQDLMARGKIEVIVVGDTNIDKVSAAVATTLGALPSRTNPLAVAAKARAVSFPKPTPQPVMLTHTGRADQAMALMAWKSDDFFTDPQRARATRLVEQILRMRLIDEFRIAEGNTYSPSTDFVSSQDYDHYGYVMARVETPPDKVQKFYDEATKIAVAMRKDGVTDDEMERARKPRIEALRKAQQTNQYWLGTLGGAQTDPRRLDAIRMTVTGLEKVTAADVKNAAALYLSDDRAWKLSILPKGIN